MNIEECKKDLYNELRIAADVDSDFLEDSFVEYVEKLLSDAGIYENIQKGYYSNDSLGIRIDGYNWNPLEKILSAFIIRFSGLDEKILISQTDIEKLGKRASKFISRIDDKKFLERLEPTDEGYMLATDMLPYLDEATKFRVVIITDHELSNRIKLNKLKIEQINGKDAIFEIWDIERICRLIYSSEEGEEFSVDLKKLSGNKNGLKTLPANIGEKGISSYLSVMPATVLRDLYDEYGQRLLASNVRTFLQFRGKPNQGMKTTLLTNPENFFAYNNGLTVTASGIKTKESDGNTYITKLDNMQIVNGGQTTSSIYFAPQEKGSQQGIDFRDIDLSKVYVQMKLTVIKDRKRADTINSNISEYANTQNRIQTADLVSNHPFHKKIEDLSRSTNVPPGESGIASKWFYERARGQYDTKIRALKKADQKQKFEKEFPKKQKFSKTDLAAFENTWRMKPYEVKKGAQKNLELLGSKLVKEWEKNEDQFGIAFYKDLIAKAILFRQSDRAIQYESEWYQLERGFKAETLTYTLAVMRHKLLEDKKDINLKRIYDQQKISSSLKSQIMHLAKVIRDLILDIDFRDGAANPSEFCKTQKAWNRLKAIDYEFKLLSKEDIISEEEASKKRNHDKLINETSSDIAYFKQTADISIEKWQDIYEFLLKHMPEDSKDMRVLHKFTYRSSGIAQNIHIHDHKTAIEMLNKAKDNGYIIQIESND